MLRTRTRTRTRTRLVSSALAFGLAACGVVATTSPASADATRTSDLAAHHSITVTLSTLMQRRGDVVTSVLLQGPNPANGRPGWSRCVDLPQSGLPVWESIPVQLAYPATYTTSAYSDFACSNGYDYRWSTGRISSRFQHWVFYTFKPPVVSLH
jgi:hypothetical protein